MGSDRALLTGLRESVPAQGAVGPGGREVRAVPLKWLSEQLQSGSAINASRLTNAAQRKPS
jgi:hypothetical protein